MFLAMNIVNPRKDERQVTRYESGEGSQREIVKSFIY